MDNSDISRYSRQMIMSEIGMEGQLKLQNSKVLIIGAGGLGCPSAQYLASAGIGTIGIVDYDTIEISNLHRQILHTEQNAINGMSKVESFKNTLQKLNTKVKINTYNVMLSRDNAIDIFNDYDIVIDATDNVTTRYLISDACVVCNKVLVSGSALRWEGQLTIYHYKTGDCIGPCYRCIYPNPPPAETVTNCSDGGVLGVVPGIIGCYQAMETIKILLDLQPSYNQKLLLFDGLSGITRVVKLRGRNVDCIACGNAPSITLQNLPDYEKFCGSGANDKCVKLNLLPGHDRITAKEYKKILNDSRNHVLVDVRQPVELTICKLQNSINLPIGILETSTRKQDQKGISGLIKLIEANHSSPDNNLPIYIVCKQGNDSQKAVLYLKKLLGHLNDSLTIKDIKGGLMSWASNVDKTFPKY